MPEAKRPAGKSRPRVDGWMKAFLVAAAVCLLFYILNAAGGEVDASSLWGMLYGTVATVFMVGSALYAVRRRTAGHRMGTARNWRQFHVYGGSLFLLLTLMHAAFRVPQGPMTAWLMGLSLWVFASGMLGVFIQTWIPRSLASLSIEALYDRIPELVDEVRGRAESLVAGLPAPLEEYYRVSIEPRMAGPENRFAFFINARAGIRERTPEFDLLRTLSPPENAEHVRELEALYITKLELDAHYTLQKALRWWLYTHVPPSLALLALVGLHIFAVFYY